MEPQVKAIIDKLPEKRSALIPLLQLAQQRYGYISPEAARWVGEQIDLEPTEVLAVSTFYAMLHHEPIGRHKLWVCHSISCYLRGCDKILQHIKQKLGIKEYETSSDGKFYLERAECLGCCDSAPMMDINGKVYGNLTIEKVDELLRLLNGEK